MGTYYQGIDRAGGFDYQLYGLPGLDRRQFRGPPIDMSCPYLAFVGAAQTFGRFVDEPFPSLLGKRLQVPVLNLAVGGAGPRQFDDPEYLDLINAAEAVVIQVLSGRSASNSLYDNSESGGSRGRLRADQTSLRAEQFFAGLAGGESERRKVVDETRLDYTSAFICLLQKVKVPRILFWFSTRAPDYQDNYTDWPHGVLRSAPQLVTKKMIGEISEFADAYVECVSSAGLPAKLWASEEAVNGSVLRNGVLENDYYPSPEMHDAAADALENTCRTFLGRPVSQTQKSGATKFVIVAAERTGTNLLIGLLNDYDGFFSGYELFNPVNIENDIIPWKGIGADELAPLVDLRRQDPISFWKTLRDRAEAEGHRAIGFKLLYGHGVDQSALLDHLSADPSIHIIHLTRRNQLRRLVSEQQARESGIWAEVVSSDVGEREPVNVSLRELADAFVTIDEQLQDFDAMFSNHPVLRIVYEDLAGRPGPTAERAARFLGLKPGSTKPSVKYKKTGAENIADAVRNLDSLRARILRWNSFFDE